MTVPPARTFAQRQPNSVADQYVRDTLTRQKPDLKATFNDEIAQIKAGTLTKAEAEKRQVNNQNPKKQSFTNKQKIFLALWIVIMAGIVAVAIKHPCREKKPGDCDFVDDSSSY
jgi:hypothetical protein